MVTNWQPQLTGREGPLYQAIADCLARDIREGRLEAGGRLPTVRALAEVLEVTVGTVHRAYGLAEKRGLVSREMGRGTFVRGQTGGTGAMGSARGDGVGAEAVLTVDLTRNEPPGLRIEETLRRTLIEMGRECDLAGMLSYGNSQGQPRHREILAGWLRGRGQSVADPETMIITSGAQQALTTAVGALSQPGEKLMVEELTYPGIKNLARLFGLELAPVAMDEEGLLPEAFEAASRDPAARLLYCMPNVHNPTTGTLSRERREAIAKIAARRGVIVIEDDVNPRGTATTPPAIAALYPERSVYITSLSKTVAPGLRVGSISSPPGLFSDLLVATQTTNWMAPPLMAELACRWIEDGTVDLLSQEHDHVIGRLQALIAECLDGLDFRQAEGTPQLWLPLGPDWSGETFAAKLEDHRVLVTPGERFAIDPRAARPAVRICVAEGSDERLRWALGLIARFAKAGPGPVAFQM